MIKDGKFTILVVDDEPLFLEMAADQLSVDFAVLTAEGVDQAIELLKTSPVDAVLSDYRMAPKNGTALMRYLSEQNHPALRLLVTANSEVAVRDHNLQGVQLDGFCPKPLILEQFIPHMRERLLARSVN